MAPQSARRDRKNQRIPPCYPNTLTDDLDPVRLVPYGLAAFIIAASPAGQMTASDQVSDQPNVNRRELLMVLDRPEIPLHTNGSENDIRCHVTKRKISGGTRSDVGRACRDSFLGIAKTCAQLGITFWDYLGARLQIAEPEAVPYLPALVARRCVLA